MNKALIGYTGFVGGNLDRQMAFSHRYNTRNIDDIDGRHFELLVCAGVPAAKWLANQNPDNDRKQIDALLKHLDTVTTDKLVLISTIDVYPEPVGVDETSPIDIEHCHAYGKHRLQLEQYLAERHDTVIIRLPGLFGSGLKKNIIYDFLHDNNVDQINADGVFQFYDLKHLAADIDTAMQHGLSLLNISSEPVSVAEVSQICLGETFSNPAITTPGARYDYRSIHTTLFGGDNGYLYSKQQVLDDLRAYVASERNA